MTALASLALAIGILVVSVGAAPSPGCAALDFTCATGSGSRSTLPLSQSRSPRSNQNSVVRKDDATNPDPIPLWGAIDAQSPSRHQQFSTGGPTGGPFRRMTVQDGDYDWGERAELGYNNRLGGLGAPWGTFFLYQPGTREITSYDLRLPVDFPISTDHWQVITQMKQTGPYSNNSLGPILTLEARRGQLEISHYGSASGAPIWAAPITLGQWTHIRWDVTYSTDPSVGRVQLTVGNVARGGGRRLRGCRAPRRHRARRCRPPRRSPEIPMDTLKAEIGPGSQGLSPGDAIPSHLRMGIYHDPALPGTHVDFTNVEVTAPVVTKKKCKKKKKHKHSAKSAKKKECKKKK